MAGKKRIKQLFLLNEKPSIFFSQESDSIPWESRARSCFHPLALKIFFKYHIAIISNPLLICQVFVIK
jgi:hypothetical protein